MIRMSIAIPLLFVIFAVGCSPETISKYNEQLEFIIVEKISQVYLDDPKTIQYALVSIEGQSNRNPIIVWKSSDEQIVTVDSEGVLSPIEIGKATITLQYTNSRGNVITSSFEIEVKNKSDIAIPRVYIAISSLILEQRSTHKLNYSILNAIDNTPATQVRWKSSDENILTVSNEGQITAQNLGEAIVTLDVNYRGKDLSDDLKVVVVASL